MPDQIFETSQANILFQRLGIQPTNIQIRERPDRVFEFNEIMHGLEITDCSPTEYNYGQKIAREMYDQTGVPRCRDITDLQHRENIRSREAIENSMFNSNGAIFQDATKLLENWLQGAVDSISGKREKFNADPSAGTTPFEKFENNWLLVFDSVGLDECEPTYYELKNKLADPALFRATEGEVDFDKIFITSGKYTIIIEDGKAILRHTDVSRP